jgi:hypothetical protein
MTGLLTLRNLLWLITTSAEILLLFFLLRRKLQNTHTAFLVYILSTIMQSALAVFIYSHWGLESAMASTVIWLSQGVVICLRFGAVFEMARRILGAYTGLWLLAKRLLGIIGLGVVGYSMLVAKKQLYLLVLNLDRGLELGIAAFVVSLLLFARFYLLPVPPLDRALAIGFCMYSCFYVINDTLFEKLLNSYLGLWGYLDVLTFLASLLIWSHAVLTYSRVALAPSSAGAIPRAPYTALSPELNIRLKQLNKQLSQLLHAEKQRS